MRFKREWIGLLAILSVLTGGYWLIHGSFNWSNWFAAQISPSSGFIGEKKWYLVSEVIGDYRARRNIVWNLEANGFVVRMHYDKYQQIRLHLGPYPSYDHAIHAAKLFDTSIVLSPILEDAHF